MDDVALGGITLKKARFGEVGYEHGHAFRKGAETSCSVYMNVWTTELALNGRPFFWYCGTGFPKPSSCQYVPIV
jgi:hypothetical protein